MRQLVDDLTAEMRKGILQWYDFIPGQEVLYIGNYDDAIVELLCQKKLVMECLSIDSITDFLTKRNIGKKYHYVIAIEVLERKKIRWNIYLSCGIC